MKTRLLILLLVFGWVVRAPAPAEGERGARPLPAEEPPARHFDPAQSAALFVGVRTFVADETLAEVPYAVDDAIDLASLFALELELVPPRRVVLALSGEAQKQESRERLERLIAAGATLHGADQEEVYRALGQQARAAGREGVLIVSFATHGFDWARTQYVTSASSILRYIERTGVAVTDVFDTVAQSPAARRFVFIDACRERLTTSRSTQVDERSRMAPALAEAIAQARGQVIFSAARSGQYAYDDRERGNGVFTASVIDGLRCEAETDEQGFVTVEKLAKYLNVKTQEWIRRNKGPEFETSSGIETNLGGSAAEMPLAPCKVAKSPPPPMPDAPADATALQPFRAEGEGEFLKVYNKKGNVLWMHRVVGLAARHAIADLDGDGSKEVVLGVQERGEDTGKVIALDARGNVLWSTDTASPYNYSGARSGKMAINALETADLFKRGKRQVVALSIDAQGWYQSCLTIIESDGRILSSYWHPGHLHHLAIGARSASEPLRIAVAGVNNDLRSVLKTKDSVPGVFLLDPLAVSGEAPPYLGKTKAGSHVWYGIIAPTDNEVDRLDVVDRDGDHQNEISVWTRMGHVLYLNFDGKVIGRAGGDNVAGAIDFRLIQ